ncbi:hypothetical protein QUA74_19475 [Microcoleus sp. LAD1_D3]|uniref:hypothetical protein n=1 Tax=Microcoleus sp. LAD1_D3 TaxID=2819365 RepID=UPI002FD5965F
MGTVLTFTTFLIPSSFFPLPSSLFLLPYSRKSRSPAMQNPGALVTVKAAIKPPGFKVFLLNEAQIIANGCWLNQQ